MTDRRLMQMQVGIERVNRPKVKGVDLEVEKKRGIGDVQSETFDTPLVSFIISFRYKYVFPQIDRIKKYLSK